MKGGGISTVSRRYLCLSTAHTLFPGYKYTLYEHIHVLASSSVER